MRGSFRLMIVVGHPLPRRRLARRPGPSRADRSRLARAGDCRPRLGVRRARDRRAVPALHGQVIDFTRLLFVALLVALGATWIELTRRQTLREFPDAQGTAFLTDTWARMSELVGRAAREAAATPSGRRRPATDMAARLAALADLHARGRADRRGVRVGQGARPRRRLRQAPPPSAPNVPGVDSDVVARLVTAAIWLVVVVVVRMLLRPRLRPLRAATRRDAIPTVAARRRTTFSFLLRVVVALVGLIGVWSVSLDLPGDEQVASAFLASSAVLAVIAGLALSTPLGNLGSGVLLAFTQPVRLGDRITVAGPHRDRRRDLPELHGARHRRRAAGSSSPTRRWSRRRSSTARSTTRDGSSPSSSPFGSERRSREARRITHGSRLAVPQGDELAIYVQVGEVTREDGVAQRRRVCAVRRRRLARRERDSRAGLGRARRGRSRPAARPRARGSRPGGARGRRRRAPSPSSLRRTRAAARRRSRACPVSPRWIGKYVPQWIGTTSPGRIRATASAAPRRIEMAAAAEPRPPAPDRDERDVDGPSSRIPSKRSVSPAK